MVPHLLAERDGHPVHGEAADLREAGRNAVHDQEREQANSGATVLVAFGDYDAMRLRKFASVHGGALVESWKLFGTASLFSDAAE
jgi:hypothetical protein